MLAKLCYRVEFSPAQICHMQYALGMSLKELTDWYSSGQNSGPLYQSIACQLYGFRSCKFNTPYYDAVTRNNRHVELKSISKRGWLVDPSCRTGVGRSRSTKSELSEYADELEGGFVFVDLTEFPVYYFHHLDHKAVIRKCSSLASRKFRRAAFYEIFVPENVEYRRVIRGNGGIWVPTDDVVRRGWPIKRRRQYGLERQEVIYG